MTHATEVEKARGVIEGIETAEKLLRSAAADIKLRCRYEPSSEDYAILTEALNKHLALAKVAVAQAQSAENSIAEGLEENAAPESNGGHGARGSDGHAV